MPGARGPRPPVPACGAGRNSARRTDPLRSRPSLRVPPLPRDARAGGRRQRAYKDAHRRHRRGEPAGGSPLSAGGHHCRRLPARRPPGRARRPRPGTPGVSWRDSCGGPAPQMPKDLLPVPRAGRRLPRQGLLPVESVRARAAAGCHLKLLPDATARYDDLNEGQKGDVLFEGGSTEIAIFGSTPRRVSADRGDAGKPAALPAVTESCAGAAWLVDSVRRATADDPRSQPRRQSSSSPQAATATWPAAVQALAHRLYAVGVPAHRLSMIGRWLFWDATPPLQHAPLPGAGCQDHNPTIRTACGSRGLHELLDALRAAVKSCDLLPRWRGVPACHAGAPARLRRPSALSNKSYILESAKLTTVAAVPRILQRQQACVSDQPGKAVPVLEFT